MPVTISKEFRWEMGHRLSDHTEGCQNLHGHSYRLTVALTGEPGSDGMVLDYGDLGKIVKPIVQSLDHTMMLHDQDVEIIHFLQSKNLALTLVPFHPTAENIALWILEQIRTPLAHNPQIQHISLTVHETSTTTATIATALPTLDPAPLDPNPSPN